MGIAFTITVTTGKDWDNDLGGWRCTALKIPGAKIENIYVEGVIQDTSWYKVLPDYATIRWSHDPRPERAAVALTIQEELLSTRELTQKWQKLAILLPLISSILAALITGSFTLKTQSTIDPSPNIQKDCNDNKKPEIEIRYPPDKSNVKDTEIVTGKSQNISPEKEIFIIVYSKNTNSKLNKPFYPYRLDYNASINEYWKSTVEIGTAADKGEAFDIIAILADKEARSELAKYFQAPDRAGLERLPIGAVVFHKITVTRE
jgi:ribosomal protein L30E